jgi:hypothetical protein
LFAAQLGILEIASFEVIYLSLVVGAGTLNLSPKSFLIPTIIILFLN